MAKDTGEKEEEPLTPTEAPDGDQNSGNSDKKKKIKKILLITVPIIITIIGAVYFFFFVIKTPKQSEGQEVQQTKEKQQVALESNTYLDIDIRYRCQKSCGISGTLTYKS